MTEEHDQDFWARTWQERHDAIEATVGPMHDEVVSFSRRLGHRIPGACAVTVPPVEDGPLRRVEWLYLSVGLSQPLSASQARERRQEGENHSGFGYEFGVLTDGDAAWAPELLCELVAYFTEPGARLVGWGDRIAFGLYVIDGARHVLVGGVDDREQSGELRALLVWPYRRRRHFLTSTGKTDLLIATGITEGEWSLAKATTSQHLLLLLQRGGVGQTTDLTRACVTSNAWAMSAWSDIQKLTAREAWDRAMQPSDGVGR
jgi:hypothetical protein